MMLGMTFWIMLGVGLIQDRLAKIMNRFPSFYRLKSLVPWVMSEPAKMWRHSEP